MNKRHLSGILFIVMIMVSGCTLANKSEAAVKLSPNDAKIYQNNVIVSQNSIQKENVQNSSIKLLAQKNNSQLLK